MFFSVAIDDRPDYNTIRQANPLTEYEFVVEADDWQELRSTLNVNKFIPAWWCHRPSPGAQWYKMLLHTGSILYLMQYQAVSSLHGVPVGPPEGGWWEE